jgi:hypothetical protein
VSSSLLKEACISMKGGGVQQDRSTFGAPGAHMADAETRLAIPTLRVTMSVIITLAWFKSCGFMVGLRVSYGVAWCSSHR